MKRINQFEDLEIWQIAREINNLIFNLSKLRVIKSDQALNYQLNKTAGSIMDNIAEGFERNGNKEFMQFLSIAKASCGELRSQLYRVMDRKYVEHDLYALINGKCLKLGKKISSLIQYLKQSDYKGVKYFRFGH